MPTAPSAPRPTAVGRLLLALDRLEVVGARRGPSWLQRLRVGAGAREAQFRGGDGEADAMAERMISDPALARRRMVDGTPLLDVVVQRVTARGGRLLIGHPDIRRLRVGPSRHPLASDSVGTRLATLHPGLHHLLPDGFLAAPWLDTQLSAAEALLDRGVMSWDDFSGRPALLAIERAARMPIGPGNPGRPGERGPLFLREVRVPTQMAMLVGRPAVLAQRVAGATVGAFVERWLAAHAAVMPGPATALLRAAMELEHSIDPVPLIERMLTALDLADAMSERPALAAALARSLRTLSPRAAARIPRAMIARLASRPERELRESAMGVVGRGSEVGGAMRR